MTDEQKNTPAEEVNPENKETSPEKKEASNKEAPEEGTKYDGGAVPK